MGITLTKLFSDLRFVKMSTPEKKRQILMRFLPDIFDSSKTPHDVYSEEQNSIENPNKKLYSGNGSTEERNTRAKDLSDLLMKNLLEDPYIQYSYDCTAKTVTDSMLDNISAALHSREHNTASLRQVVVNHCSLDSVFSNTGMYDALQTLAETGTYESLCYGVFLLLLCAVFHNESWKLKYFYSREKIQSVVSEDMKVCQKINDHFRLFNDPGYFGSYYVYTRDIVNERLMPYGRLQIGRRSAVLELTSTKITSGEEKTDRYYCTPVLCEVSELVYMIFENRHGVVRIVVFQYEQFSSGIMYLRTAVCISSAPRQHYPVITKMIISASELSGHRIQYALGRLKMNSNDFLISEESYEAFRQEFKDEPWMKKFTSHFDEKILASGKKYFELSEISILAASGTGMGPDDRLRAVEALKYCSREKEYIKADTPDRLGNILLSEPNREK